MNGLFDERAAVHEAIARSTDDMGKDEKVAALSAEDSQEAPAASQGVSTESSCVDAIAANEITKEATQSGLDNSAPLTSDFLLKSAYEQARENNIKRNNTVLMSLGLLPDTAPTSMFATASTTTTTTMTEKKKKRKRPDVPTPRREPSRSSSRLRGDKVEDGTENFGEATLPSFKPRPPPPTFDMAKYERLIERHLTAGLVLPPNASYEHTVHRVKTMSEKALLTRVKVIERAHGAYAVIKMQMFAEVLILEGYEDVAKEADGALQRLLDTPKFKGRNWQEMLEIAKKKK